MEKLNFYSYSECEKFLKGKFNSICLLGACTARNIASGIEFFSDKRIKTYAPYETVFNLPSLLNDLEIVSRKLNHKITINFENQQFSDEIRFWNRSEDIEEVIQKNRMIDNQIVESIQNSELVIVALGSVEMWSYSDQILNKLPKSDFEKDEVKNMYLEVDVLHDMMKKIINCINEINPLVTIKFSIPYVLLKASEKFSNLHLATMENYRILKNAIMCFGEDFYFPEYELFKFNIEKNSHDFQLDNRHPSIYLISEVTKHIVDEIDKSYSDEILKRSFMINKVNEKGKIYGKEYLY